MADLAKLAPSKELSEHDRRAIFDHFTCRLAAHRNAAELYALAESHVSSKPEAQKEKLREEFSQELNRWGQALLENAWAACSEPGGGKCPELDPLTDTSTGHLPKLPQGEDVEKLFNTILFLHLTTSKSYSARTRSFLSTFAELDETAIVATLKNPEAALKHAEQHADRTEAAREEHAVKNKTLRMVGMGLGAVAGGVLVGVTGGLAAPLVGAAASTILGIFGIGGTAAGLLATGLAGSSVVCGALFGVYGAKSTAEMVERHTREIRDLAVLPVRKAKDTDTLSVRLCVSGWLSDPSDVTEPWTIFGGDDTSALQWEIQALQDLSNAFGVLLKEQTVQLVKAEVLRHTVFAGLMAALGPMAFLKVGKVIDNPWSIAQQRAIKTGQVLGTLLAKRAFGERPLTLVGYSLGSLVLLEALKHLATLPPSESAHLIQHVFLFGCPASTAPSSWASARRVVSGRLVNGYTETDYILAVLCRASSASWSVAGLKPVDVQGIENIEYKDVNGHLMWRGMIGKCLADCGAPGIIPEEVEKQMKEVARKIEEEMEASQAESEEIAENAPTPERRESGKPVQR